ncbi:amidase family protein, partial [Enterococcus faecalis]|uniref:amidase family protein n=2 Tax=Enterococcus TaxID=1350 RepID=UPI0005343403
MEKLYDKSLTELHDLLVSKEITAVDLTEETLNRIQDTEEQLGSFITVSEEKAMALAKAIDLKGITESNPLAGIPIGIKDNIVTKDILTTAGSKILHNFDPIYDATVMDKV